MATLAHCLKRLGYAKGQTSAEMDRLVDRVYSALTPPMSEDAKVQQDAVAAVIRDYESDLDMLRTALGMKVQPLTKPVQVEAPTGPTMAGREVPKGETQEERLARMKREVAEKTKEEREAIAAIANPATGEAARVAHDYHLSQLTPEKRRERAEQAKSGDTSEATVRAKVLNGDMLQPDEMEVAHKLANDYAEAYAKGDEAAKEYMDAYTVLGTKQSDAFRARRDQIETPEKRRARLIGEAINLPGADTAKAIQDGEKAKEEIAKIRREAAEQKKELAALEKIVTDLETMLQEAIVELEKAGGPVQEGETVSMSVSGDAAKRVAELRTRLEVAKSNLAVAKARAETSATENEKAVAANRERIKKAAEAQKKEEKDTRAKLTTMLKKLGMEDLTIDEAIKDPVKAVKMLRAIHMGKKSVSDAVHQYYVMALLSGPKTMAVNATANTAWSLFRFGMERLVEASANEVAAKLGWKAGDLRLADLKAFWRGVIPELSAAGQYAARSYIDNLSSFDLTYVGEQMAEKQFAKFVEQGEATNAWPVRWISYISTRPLVAADNFNKRLIGGAEARMRAEKAGKAAGLTGDKLANFIASELNTPTSQSWKDGISAAQESTFTDEFADGSIEGVTIPIFKTEAAMWEWLGKAGAYLSKLPVLRYLVLFSRISTILTKTAARRASPLAILRLHQAYQNMQKANSTQKDVDTYYRVLSENITGALTAALGYSIIGALIGDGDEPWITGGENAGEYEYMKSMGKTMPPPYSIKIGNKWLGYGNLDPLGSILGVFVDTMKGQPVKAVHLLSEKSYLRSAADALEIVMIALRDKSGDKLGALQSKAASMLARTGSQFLAPNMIQSLLRSSREGRVDRKIVVDGVQQTLLNTGKRMLQQSEWVPQVTGFLGSDALNDTPMYDAFGRVIPTDVFVNGGPDFVNFIARLLSPVYAKQIDPKELLKADRVILEHNKTADEIYTPEVPSRKYKLFGTTYTMTDAQYAEFLKARGEYATELSEKLIDMKDGTKTNIAKLKGIFSDAHEQTLRQLALGWQGQEGLAKKERMEEIISLVRTIGVGRDAERKRGVVKGEDVVARRKAIERAKEAEVKLAKLATPEEIGRAFDFAREGLVQGKKDMEKKRALNKLQREYGRKR